ncbi:unnamed protein product [Allacma fusca]|uniref:Uncharacterized protein n=1 Tax=Allacma fusca TaxID=39272 RepID=A0A8J2LTA1_9HEXA|nr:unnamed protein product [Allacma fusca]
MEHRMKSGIFDWIYGNGGFLPWDRINRAGDDCPEDQISWGFVIFALEIQNPGNKCGKILVYVGVRMQMVYGISFRVLFSG